MKIKKLYPELQHRIESVLCSKNPHTFDSIQTHLPLYLEDAFASHNLEELLRRSRRICSASKNENLTSFFAKTRIPLFERISCILKTKDAASINEITAEELRTYLALKPLSAFSTLLSVYNHSVFILYKISAEHLGRYIHQYPQLISEILTQHSTYALNGIKKETWHLYLSSIPMENRYHILQHDIIKYNTKINYQIRSILKTIEKSATASEEALPAKRHRCSR